MKNTLIASFSLIALATLGACGQSEPVQGGNGASADPMAEELANAAPVAMPPSIKSGKTYRCKSSGLVKVEFLDDDLTANITPEGASSVHLTATEKGKPFEGSGYKVVGSASPLTITLPGKSAESCKS
ncbi:MAG TPA: hypothetical protein VF463_11300 [Sphingobium sp.]